MKAVGAAAALFPLVLALAVATSAPVVAGALDQRFDNNQKSSKPAFHEASEAEKHARRREAKQRLDARKENPDSMTARKDHHLGGFEGEGHGGAAADLADILLQKQQQYAATIAAHRHPGGPDGRKPAEAEVEATGSSALSPSSLPSPQPPLVARGKEGGCTHDHGSELQKELSARAAFTRRMVRRLDASRTLHACRLAGPLDQRFVSAALRFSPLSPLQPYKTPTPQPTVATIFGFPLRLVRSQYARLSMWWDEIHHNELVGMQDESFQVGVIVIIIFAYLFYAQETAKPSAPAPRSQPNAEPKPSASQSLRNAAVEGWTAASNSTAQNDLAAGGGFASLMDAMIHTNEDKLKAALDGGADPNETDVKGRTPLLLAASLGHPTLVRLLIEGGASVHVTMPRTGASAVWIAAQEGHDSVIRVLAENSASVTMANYKSVTPVYIAAQKGHGDVIRTLASFDANVNTPASQTGCTPLYVASQCGHTDAVDALAEAGANVNEAALDGAAPIHV